VRLGAALTLYLDELRRRDYAASTHANAECALACFFAHLRRQRVLDVRRVSEAHLVSFLRRLQRRKSERTRRLVAASTCALYASAVKSFFAFLERERVVLVDPMRELRLPRRERLPRALSAAQLRRIVSAPAAASVDGQRNRAVLELLYGTGLRRSECARLDLQDVDLVQGTLLVRDGKGRKDRYVPLPGRALRALDAYLAQARPQLAKHAHESALFLTKYGRRLSGQSVAIVVRRQARALGIAASTHVLRHSCATHLLQGGASVREIQRLLGHKELSTTALYTRVDTRGLRAMLDRSHPRERAARRAR
jgi:integrase/recombinase XerD